MSAHFFETSARSAIGLVRQGNEDSGFVSAQLIAVADGMGGHAAGEVASRIAVEVLQTLSPTLISPEIDQDSVEDLLMHSLHSIDSEISVVTDEEIENRHPEGGEAFAFGMPDDSDEGDDEFVGGVRTKPNLRQDRLVKPHPHP